MYEYAELEVLLVKDLCKTQEKLAFKLKVTLCKEEELATNSSKETVLSDATTANHNHATDKP